MTGYKSKGVWQEVRATYLPATVIRGMVEGSDAVEEAGQLLLCRVSRSTLQECKSAKELRTKLEGVIFACITWYICD